MKFIIDFFRENREYEKFIATGEVSEKTLQRIANKISRMEPLSEKENAIFHWKTGEINEILISIHKKES